MNTKTNSGSNYPGGELLSSISATSRSRVPGVTRGSAGCKWAGDRRDRPDEKSIEHAESNHGVGVVLQICGTLSSHIQQLRIVLLKMLKNLCHADVGPATVEFS